MMVEKGVGAESTLKIGDMYPLSLALSHSKKNRRL